MSTFDEIAAAQGWNADSREQILRDFIDTGGQDLDDYAQKRAFEENEESKDIHVTVVRPPVPAFTQDVTGKYFGGAYWNDADYRVTVETDDTTENFLLRVEDSSGAEITEVAFNDTQADRLRDVARTSEEADDEGLGLSREIHWHVGDDRNEVDLDMNFLEALAEWIDTIFDGDES